MGIKSDKGKAPGHQVRQGQGWASSPAILAHFSPPPPLSLCMQGYLKLALAMQLLYARGGCFTIALMPPYHHFFGALCCAHTLLAGGLTSRHKPPLTEPIIYSVYGRSLVVSALCLLKFFPCPDFSYCGSQAPKSDTESKPKVVRPVPSHQLCILWLHSDRIILPFATTSKTMDP